MIVAALAILGLVLGGGVIGWHAHALAQPWRPAPAPDCVLCIQDRAGLTRRLGEQSMLAALYRCCALSGEKPRAADVELAEVRKILDAREAPTP